MDEDEWLTCTDAERMLDFVRAQASNRKLRLFACALYGLVSHFLPDKRVRKAVRLGERYADGNATADDLRSVGHAAWQATCKAHRGDRFRQNRAMRSVAWQAVCAAIADGHNLRTSAQFAVAGFLEHAPEESLFQPCDLLREMVGPLPFRPVTLDPAWLTPTMVALAQGVYDERAFDRLPILADALEETGCQDTDILGHLRAPGLHVRGCWPVDLLLAKS